MKKTGPEAKLLVVDDEPNIRELLSTSLRFAGFEVVAAGNGRDALAAAELHNPDLAVLDACHALGAPVVELHTGTYAEAWLADDRDRVAASYSRALLVDLDRLLAAVPHDDVAVQWDAAVETAADRVIQQISEWCAIPDLAERIVVRRTISPGDFAAAMGLR